MIKLILINFLFILFTNLGFAQDSLKLHFIDIGPGDVFLIQYQNNNLLIDTGPALSGRKLADYLTKNGVAEIKYLIITHPHPDHLGGIFFILPKFRVRQICDNGQPLWENRRLEWLYNVLVRSGKNYRALKKGDRLKLGDVDLVVLWPLEKQLGSSYNENSLVIKLNYNNFSCLFTGDLNHAGEKKLLKDRVNIRADILKVGHHGHMDATSRELLDAVSPKAAIISTDPKKKKRTPSPAILELLKRRNIKVYRTDKDGNIVISVDKNSHYTIETEK